MMDGALAHSGGGYVWEFKPQISASQKRKTQIQKVLWV
jgi:hypothetical protein